MNIDKGIPIPDIRPQANYAEDVRKMEVGDSVLLKTPREAKSFSQCLRNAGFGQVTRKSTEGYRVWKAEKS